MHVEVVEVKKVLVNYMFCLGNPRSNVWRSPKPPCLDPVPVATNHQPQYPCCSKDVRLPVQLQRAMAAEAEAARDARAKVTVMLIISCWIYGETVDILPRHCRKS